MHNSTLAKLSGELRAKRVSAVEVARYYLDRIASAKSLNAFITVDEEKTLALAKAADARIAKGDAAPLTGIPIAHKDLFCADGWRTTCGSKILENFVAPHDPHAIGPLKRAGAVILGKNNIDEFAIGSCNQDPHLRPVDNPVDPAL